MKWSARSHTLMACLGGIATISLLLPIRASALPVDCTAAELAVVKSASAKAQSALRAAVAEIRAEAPAAVERLEQWLGVKSSQQAKAVSERLQSIQIWLSKATFRCENQTNIKLGDVYAYVDPKLGLTITLGVFFFEAPDSNSLSSKAGILIHEASHFAIAGAAKDPKIYGPSEALALAKSSAASAQENAENIEYFVESLFFRLTP